MVEERDMEQAEQLETDQILEELQLKDNNWESKKTKARSNRSRSGLGSTKANKKAREPEEGARPSKRRKYELIGGEWGGGKTTGIEAKTTLMGSELHDIRERSKEIRIVEELRAPDKDGEETDQEVKIIQLVDDQDIRPPPPDQCTPSTVRGQEKGDASDPPPWSGPVHHNPIG